MNLTTLITTGSALLLCYAGMSALCLAMDRHQRQLLGYETGARPRRHLRIVGGVLLLLALLPCVWLWHGGVGTLAWTGLLAVAALLLAAMLSYAPRHVMRLASVGLVLGLAGSVWLLQADM